MQFKEGATVMTQDGHKVGNIRHFVVDPDTQAVTHLVVEKGFLFTEDRVVPMDAVTSTTEDEVWLSAAVDDPEDLPPFEETYFVPPYKEDGRKPHREDYTYPLYYYPPLGMDPGLIAYPGWYTPYGVRQTHQNIPENTIVVEKGMKVTARDGEKFGTVSRIFTDSRSGHITHFVVSQGVIFTHEKLVPVIWVDDITEGEIRLFVGTETLKRLNDFQSQFES